MDLQRPDLQDCLVLSLPTARFKIHQSNGLGVVYSVARQTALVLKGQNVFRAQRIEFDPGCVDVLQALMAIRPALTGGQMGVTYEARRGGQIGPAEIT